jgi:hypothetical protein
VGVVQGEEESVEQVVHLVEEMVGVLGVVEGWGERVAHLVEGKGVVQEAEESVE